jgi:hypothetical protein
MKTCHCVRALRHEGVEMKAFPVSKMVQLPEQTALVYSITLLQLH